MTVRQSQAFVLDPQLREDWLTIAGFLNSSPEDFELVLTMARLREPPDVIDFVTDNARHEAARQRAESYLAAAIFGACGRCFHPVVVFPDSRKLAWPQLETHRCSGMEILQTAAGSKPTPVASSGSRGQPRNRVPA